MASFTPNPETLHNIEYHQTNAIGIFKYFANENFDQECHGSNWTVEHNHFHASNNHSMAIITKSANPFRESINKDYKFTDYPTKTNNN